MRIYQTHPPFRLTKASRSFIFIVHRTCRAHHANPVGPRGGCQGIHIIHFTAEQQEIVCSPFYKLINALATTGSPDFEAVAKMMGDGRLLEPFFILLSALLTDSQDAPFRPSNIAWFESERQLGFHRLAKRRRTKPAFLPKRNPQMIAPHRSLLLPLPPAKAAA